MRKIVLAILAVFVLISPASAHHRHHRSHHVSHSAGYHHHRRGYDRHYRTVSYTSTDVEHPSHPSFAWCGWWMRLRKGVASASYNLARNWAHWGRPSSPVPGAVVVYPHHVAEIVGNCDGRGCVMISGNDGHAVRTRYRSLAGAIAIRE